MNNRGKFIVLEGLDGCGKSTQTKMLIEQLEKEGQRCKFIHFPILEQGVYGKLIAQFLRGELTTQPLQLSTSSMALRLQAMARYIIMVLRCQSPIVSVMQILTFCAVLTLMSQIPKDEVSYGWMT